MGAAGAFVAGFPGAAPGLQCGKGTAFMAGAMQQKSPDLSIRASHVLVGRAGVEPTTNGLKVRCSTN
jgi:hypothetical protein